MQASRPVPETPERGASPVFFTGCSDSVLKFQPVKEDSTKLFSSIDFDQLKKSVSFILSKPVNTYPVSLPSNENYSFGHSFQQNSNKVNTAAQFISHSANHQHYKKFTSVYGPNKITGNHRLLEPVSTPQLINYVGSGSYTRKSEPTVTSGKYWANHPENSQAYPVPSINILPPDVHLNHGFESTSGHHSHEFSRGPPHMKKPALLPRPDVLDGDSVASFTYNSTSPRVDEYLEDYTIKPVRKRALLESPLESHQPNVVPPPSIDSPVPPLTSFDEGNFVNNQNEEGHYQSNYETPEQSRKNHFNRRPPTLKRPFESPATTEQNKRPKFMPQACIPRHRNSHGIWEKLSDDIWQLFEENKQSQAVFNAKMELRNELHDILLKTFPKCGLYVVGSSMTELGGNNSDMDMCLMLSHNEIAQDEEATEILTTVYEVFSQYNFLTDLELIPAKVPILRFQDSIRKVDVDLNVNNAVGIRNTQLLRSYARIDKRVSPLVLLTKMWAKCHNINDAKNHTLSSYSLVLMVIHFLQYGCSPPVLPCLQALVPDKFKPYSDVRTLKLVEELPSYVSENSQPLSELFLGFLNYYANEFDYTNNAISVRTGSIMLKSYAMSNNTSPKNKRGHWKFICIEEPFDLTNTACSIFKDSAFHYIRDVFLRSWNMLRSSGNLRSVLDLRRVSRETLL